MRRPGLLLTSSFIIFFLLFFSDATTISAQNSAADTRLVVVLSVDQMRYDYLERFKPYFKHGFKRLLDEGAVFTDAHHKHAITHTAPGHASLSTGCHPSKHGVVENDFFNGETYEVDYCVVDDNVEIIGVENDGAIEGKSPKNLKRSTLGDWLKKSDRNSKVYAVAFKDRSSILLSGDRADRAFWFDNLTTRFVSSSYYKEEFPEWALSFDAKTLMANELESGWTKKFPEEVYKASREDDLFVESGQFLPSFPHTKKYMIGRVNPAMKDAILLWTTPFGDAFAIKFAERLIEEKNLGQDDHIDILNLGCSMADAIGHHFGPYSHEIQDYYLQMDEYLGGFFDFLDEKVGKDHYLVAFSSDHGVLPMPEYLIREGESAKRIVSQDFDTAIEKVAEEVSEKLGLTQPFIISYGTTGFTLHYGEAYEKRIKPAKLQQTLAEELEKLDFVNEVFTTAELEEKNPTDEYQRLFQNSFYPDRGYDMKIRYKENYLVNHRSTGTSHGTPYTYDTHIPMIFMGSSFRPGKYNDQVGTIDFAPTIARALGIKIDKGIDGKVIEKVIKP